MNKNKNSTSFFDSNTILAMVLTFGIFIGWQKYMEYKYPKAEIKKVEESLPAKTNEKNPGKSSVVGLSADVEKPNVAEKTLDFENEFWKFTVSSKGLSLNDVVIKKINKVAKIPYEFSKKPFYPTSVDGQVLNFNFKKENENTFKGVAVFKGNTFEKTIRIDSSKFLVESEIKILNKSVDKFSIEHTISEVVKKPKTILFLPAFQRDEFYLKSLEDEERKVLTIDLVLEKPEEYENTGLVSLGDQYFAAAFLNTGKLSPSVTFNQNNKIVDVKVAHSFSDKISIDQLEYKLFIGPKNVELLSSISPELNDLVNFTYLGFISRPIIKALNYFYSVLGNYGLAVIVLTFLIRLLIMPLAIASFKSMKRMQVIQPELKRIKEKYKDQPQVINQKTMQIMKDNKVNPLGGCLPMLIQLPIFFAFYRGLSESVDLFQAPFFGWITDLSKMDPYFLFPILSMAGMVIHQLVTPSTMDKMQKRMMLIMPVVFGILFVTLPSALTLYMAVSTWFGIAQHVIFLRDKPAAA